MSTLIPGLTDLESVTITANGSITAASSACTAQSCVWIVVPTDYEGLTVKLSGVFAATLQFEVSWDGNVWLPATAVTGETSVTATGTWNINLNRAPSFRVRASSFSSGPVRVNLTASILGFFGADVGSGAGGFIDPTTTKGDLIARGPTAPPTRLGVGANGQVLTADSTQPTGLKWSVPSGGGGIVQDEGVALTPRGALNFVGSGVSAVDDPANNRITVTIAGGGGGGSTPSSSFAVFPTEAAPPTIMRTDFSGTLGYRFQVTHPVKVIALGRLYATGNHQDHFIGLWNADTHTLLATGTILAATPSDAHGFKNVTVTTVTLAPAINYTVATTETTGGDTWKDNFLLAGLVSSVIIPGLAMYGAVDSEPTSNNATDPPGSTYVGPSLTLTEADPAYPVGVEGAVQIKNGPNFGSLPGLVAVPSTTILQAPGIDSYNAQGANLGPPDDLAAFQFTAGSDLEHTPPGYPNLNGVRVQFRNWQGQNVADNSCKTTINMVEAFADYSGAGQRQLAFFYGNAAGYGDFQGLSVMQQYGGGMNAAGDEGVQCFRGDLRGGDPALMQRTIVALAPTSSCNTTILDALSPASYAQVVRVASTAGFAVGDRVIIGRAFNPGGPELVVVQAVGSGTITAKIMQSHSAGATVTPSTGLNIGSTSTNFLGQFRMIRRVRTSGAGYYATGVISNVSSPAFTGSGVTWSPTMVGGDAINPGCISLAVDDSVLGVSMSPAWHQIRSVDSASTMTIQGANYYEGNASGSGSWTYQINFAARIMACDWIDYYTPGSIIWLDTPPSVGGWQVGDLIEQPASTDSHGIGMRIQILPGTVQANRWNGVRVENPSAVQCDTGFSVWENPYVFDVSNPGWTTGISISWAGTAIVSGGCRDYLITAYSSPGHPAMIYWPQTGVAKDIKIGPNPTNGSFRIETRWPGSGLELFNIDTSRTVFIDPSKTTVPTRTITIPDGDGTICLLGPGPVSVFLGGAVGSFVNLGSFTDTLGNTGALNGFITASVGAGCPSRLWVFASAYDITVATWAVMQPLVGTASSGDDYILEAKVTGFTTQFRFRKTAGSGSVNISAALYIATPSGFTFTPDTSSGTETSPSPYSYLNSVISQVDRKLILTNVMNQQTTIDPTPVTSARTITLPDAGGQMGLRVAAPAHATDAGTPGTWAADAGYHYYCVASGNWVRTAWGAGGW